MRKVLYMALAAMMLTFASCDKIDPAEYTVFAGANGTWYDSDAEINPMQRVLIEKYTGVRCINCPGADEVIHQTMESYGEKVVAMSIHAGGYARPLGKEIDLRTDKGTAWNDYFGVTDYPAAMLNRAKKDNGSWDIFVPTASFNDKIDAIVNSAANVAMMAKCTPSEQSGYDAEIHLQFLKEVSAKLTLTLVIIEDDIHTPQMSSHVEGGLIEDYQQNHAVREIVTDEWGIDVDANGQVGTKRFIRLNFNPSNIANADKCRLIAFVSNKETREIVNVAECNLR